MSVQLKKNIVIFCWALVIRVVLISIEVFFNYTGIVLQAIYVVLILSLFVLIWCVNRPMVAELKSKLFIRVIVRHTILKPTRTTDSYISIEFSKKYSEIGLNISRKVTFS